MRHRHRGRRGDAQCRSRDAHTTPATTGCSYSHPPLGKVVFWFTGRLVGYDARVCEYETISKDYDPRCKFIFLR